ncbi:MAG: response regulator [Gammaproteobacteria bacterium]|nr:response regulator [Gammaproteobacteria bacterium]
METGSILVVDDSPTDLHVLTGYLTKHGYSTLAASNGEEAVTMSKTHKPDVILMDIVMPGMNGYEATRSILRDPETSDIPIVLVSSKGQATDKIWGMRQGARDYLVKPISEQVLIEKIASL